MKYNTEVIINLPVTKVIELFDNADNMKKWQPELVSYEQISGTPGQVGAKAKLNYQMSKRKVEMIEIITERDLPKKFSATYEADGVFNFMSNSFEEIEPGKTKWVAENEFQFKGFMKLMGILMPGAFKKQSQKYLDQFKAFAESQ